jgi:hypothetical protein
VVRLAREAPKDIAKEPKFWAEHAGEIIPRHTVYDLVPEEGVSFEQLLDYLNAPVAKEWMEAIASEQPMDFFGSRAGSCASCRCRPRLLGSGRGLLRFDGTYPVGFADLYS